MLEGPLATPVAARTSVSMVVRSSPPVKSVVLRKRGALRGIRLISYDSLMRYLAELA